MHGRCPFGSEPEASETLRAIPVTSTALDSIRQVNTGGNAEGVLRRCNAYGSYQISNS